MWIIFALLAAFFAGVTTVFAKAGITNVDSTLATAIRTTIILIFTIIIVLIVKSYVDIYKINFKIGLFLILSGITTALLWLSYFKALELADVNKVAPVDKTSIILTLILSSIFLHEKITYIKIISMILLLIGTVLMTYKKDNNKTDNKWLLFAILTAIFTSLATILGKIGINNIESNFGTMIRTIIVFLIIWIFTISKGKFKDIKFINKKSWIFIILSGITTGLSWLCYFKALQLGEASLVFPMEKLSIVVAVLFSSLYLKEKLNYKSILGLFLIIVATLLLII